VGGKPTTLDPRALAPAASPPVEHVSPPSNAQEQAGVACVRIYEVELGPLPVGATDGRHAMEAQISQE
jgi:hypothetical protein